MKLRPGAWYRLNNGNVVGPCSIKQSTGYFTIGGMSLDERGQYPGQEANRTYSHHIKCEVEITDKETTDKEYIRIATAPIAGGKQEIHMFPKGKEKSFALPDGHVELTREPIIVEFPHTSNK